MTDSWPPGWEKIRFRQYGPERDFSDDDVAHLQRAVSELMTTFGDDFPLLAGRRHPLIGYFVNDTSWTRFWLIEFSDALRSVKDSDGVEGLLARISAPEKFNEGLSVLNCAHSFAKMGFEITFDPKDLEPGFARRPDILARETSGSFNLVIEVTTIGESRASIDAMQKFGRISKAIFSDLPHSHLAAGKLAATPLDDEMTRLEIQIPDTITKSVEQDTMETLQTRALRMAVAPRSQEQSLRAWSRREEVAGGSFSGPGVESGLSRRVPARFLTKTTQLPRSMPGLVWIELQTLGAEYAEAWVLDQALREAPHVVGVVLSWAIGFLGEDPPIEDPSIVVRKSGKYHYRAFRLLENQHTQVPKARETLTIIRRALEA